MRSTPYHYISPENCARLLGELNAISNRSTADLLERACHFFAEGHPSVVFPIKKNDNVSIEKARTEPDAILSNLDSELLKLFVRQLLILAEGSTHGVEFFGSNNFDFEVKKVVIDSLPYIQIKAHKSPRRDSYPSFVSFIGHNAVGEIAEFKAPSIVFMKPFSLKEDAHLCYVHIFYFNQHRKRLFAAHTQGQCEPGPSWHQICKTDPGGLNFHQWVMQSHQRLAHKEALVICVVNKSVPESMEWHEKSVDDFIYKDQSLNLIRGGMNGRMYLQRLGLLQDPHSASNQDVTDAIEIFARLSISGPNPDLKRRWLQYSEGSGRPPRLTRDQVKMIRQLHGENMSISDIMNQVGARSRKQVFRVLHGNTYKEQ